MDEDAARPDIALLPARLASGCILVLLGLGVLVTITACRASADKNPSWAPAPHSSDSLSYSARVEGDRFILKTLGGERTFIPGVNIGSTIPGTSPGEVSVRRADYRRWFPQMTALGLRAVRVYTILPPHFYEELAAYNRDHPDAPLYLLQGVWIPEDDFYETQDLFDADVHRGFKQEIDDVVKAVHGELRREERRGIAWGTWSADVSPWVIGYSPGVEWDPQATYASDQKNAGRKPYSGRFFSSKSDASPTETWLAEMLDHLAASEAAHGRSVPLTFTNWPTTDPLHHPEEPIEREDLVGVDANHIVASPAWPSGFFASYHAYPYYPDFQRHEKGLYSAMRNGKSDPYAGYVAALREHHKGMPVMITEFGVPSAMGSAHSGPLGRDQGGHSEQQAMAIDADLLGIIHEQGMAGGFAFEWVDEWFKFTWNTIDYELPKDRRQLWRNPWTNEEHFGLVAMEPGETQTVTIDGDGAEWDSAAAQTIYEGPRGVREVRAIKDEAFLYLLIVTDGILEGEPGCVTLGFDVLPGGGALPDDAAGRRESDCAVRLQPGSGQAFIRAENDQFTTLYGRNRGYVPVEDTPDGWLPQRLITNKPHLIPSTGRSLPSEHFEIGTLKEGTTDPDSAAFDSRVTFAFGLQALEVRLPYAAIGFADPSSLRALKVGSDGSLTTDEVARVGIVASADGTTIETNGYGWEPWQKVTWHERPKAGLDAFAEAVRETQR